MTAATGGGSRPSLPPAGVHPRVLVDEAHLDAIRRNLADPLIAPYFATLRASAEADTDGHLPGGVYDAVVKNAVEANAFLYLVHGEEAVGRRAVAQLRNVLASFDPPDPDSAHIFDIRKTGSTLFLAALVYDWCYPLLTDEDRTAVIVAMKVLAAHQEVGYPPVRLSAVTSHGSEYELERDQLAAGIAVYDEDPELFELAAGRFAAEYVPARNFFYRSGRYHQGDSYQGARFAPEMCAAALFDRMGGDAGFVPEQEDVVTGWIHQRRPDGQLMRDGDTYLANYHPPGRYWSGGYTIVSMLLSVALFGNGAHQDHLLAQMEHGYQPGPELAVWFCLFLDPTVERRPAALLPRTRFDREPLAAMIARTDWDDGPDADTVIAQAVFGGYQFNNHMHLDAGAFQIYHRGALALDSGIYEGRDGGWGSAHDINYNKRTIAHNALVIRDPDERFTWRGTPVSNDGGQRFPGGGEEPRTLEELLDPARQHRNARSVSTWAGPDPHRPVFSLIAGDLTPAYGPKVRRVTRSAVFVDLRSPGRPAALLVRDSVATADPAFATAFLLHSREEPRVDGSEVVVARTDPPYDGVLRMTTLLPAEATITTVGGPGREYEVDGVDYPNRTPEDSTVDPGAWRVEVEPATRGPQTEFLHVLQPHAPAAEPFEVRTERVGGVVLVQLHDTTTVFSAGAGPIREAVEVEIAGDGTHFLAVDLAAGGWTIEASGNGRASGTERSEESRTLYSVLDPGRYRLAPSA